MNYWVTSIGRRGGTPSTVPPIHWNQYACHFHSPCEENKRNYDYLPPPLLFSHALNDRWKTPLTLILPPHISLVFFPQESCIQSCSVSNYISFCTLARQLCQLVLVGYVTKKLRYHFFHLKLQDQEREGRGVAKTSLIWERVFQFKDHCLFFFFFLIIKWTFDFFFVLKFLYDSLEALYILYRTCPYYTYFLRDQKFAIIGLQLYSCRAVL